MAKDFVEIYAQALASQLWLNIEPLMSDKVCVSFSDGSVYRGKDAVKAAYERNFEVIKNEVFLITNLHFLRNEGDVAVYLFDFQWKGYVNNQLAEGSGHGTTVLVKEEGKWKILTEHLGKA